MSIKFAIRGDSLTAYKHSGGGKTPFYIFPSTTIPAVAADAGAIGGQIINFDGSGSLRAAVYPGFQNSTATGQISILHRLSLNYSGSPSANVAILNVNGPRIANSVTTNGIQLVHLSTGRLVLNLTNSAAQAGVTTNFDLGAWSPTSGTYYDVVITWDGTTTSNAIKIYIDGTLFAQTTSARTWISGNGFVHCEIGFGYAFNQIQNSANKTNEFVLWDEVIDPTSGGLNLNGSSRSAFVTVTGTLDPTNSTDPGVDNVATGIGYIINGVSLTGNSDEPAQSDVRFGVQYDNATKTGTLVVPIPANVKNGIATDNTTGTLVSTDPGEANVSSGVTYTIESVAKTGTRDTITYLIPRATITGQTTTATLTERT